MSLLERLFGLLTCCDIGKSNDAASNFALAFNNGPRLKRS
jgi:hypothetical protein